MTLHVQNKHLLLVIATQAICIAIGLWMHKCYLTSSIDRIQEQRGWSEIKAATDELTSAVEIDPNAEPWDSDAWGSNLPTPAQRNWSVLVLDQDWTVARDFDAAGGLTNENHETALSVEWSPKPGLSTDDHRWQFGLATLRGGEHLGAVRMLGGNRGSILVHRAVNDILAEAEALKEPLPAIAGLTVLWTCMLSGLAAYVIIARFRDKVTRERAHAASETMRQSQSLVRTRDAVIFGLAKLAESRDPETGDHLERISIYSTTLASALRQKSKYAAKVTPAFVRLIGISSALHDIGKVGIEDHILLKPGKLTQEERQKMKEHAVIGARCLQQIEQRLGSSNFLQMAREIAQCHHERWDGLGYPDQLSGDEIPLAARIVAVADVYDALASRRVYKGPHPHDRCVAIIRRESGNHFDPDLVEAFLSIDSRFRDIALQYGGAEDVEFEEGEGSCIGLVEEGQGALDSEASVVSSTAD